MKVRRREAVDRSGRKVRAHPTSVARALFGGGPTRGHCRAGRGRGVGVGGVTFKKFEEKEKYFYSAGREVSWVFPHWEGGAHSLCFRLDRRGVVSARGHLCHRQWCNAAVHSGKRSSLSLAVAFRGHDVMLDAPVCLCFILVLLSLWPLTFSCSVTNKTSHLCSIVNIVVFFVVVVGKTAKQRLYIYACS